MGSRYPLPISNAFDAFGAWISATLAYPVSPDLGVLAAETLDETEMNFDR